MPKADEQYLKTLISQKDQNWSDWFFASPVMRSVFFSSFLLMLDGAVQQHHLAWTTGRRQAGSSSRRSWFLFETVFFQLLRTAILLLLLLMAIFTAAAKRAPILCLFLFLWDEMFFFQIDLCNKIWHNEWRNALDSCLVQSFQITTTTVKNES